MKNILKTSFLLTFTALIASGCGQTTSTTNTKKSTSTSTSTSTTPTTTTPTDPTAIAGCAGVYRAGASRCYFTEIPKIIFSGNSSTVPVTNVTIWSSATGLPASFSPNNFMTDGSFSVRFKPTVVSSGTSQQGRACSGPMAYNWKRVKLNLMLRRQGESISTVYEASANIDAYSTKIYLPVIAGATAPYVLEVTGIQTDHRCNAAYGTLSTNEQAACTSGTYWGTMPLVSTNNPTSCVGVNLEFATDSTYDLP